MNRLTELTQAIDQHLKQFGAIDTAQEPWSYGGLCDSDRKPHFPNLYISRSKDPGLMSMQGEGSATIVYKVRRRNVDEDQADGVPLYGADIEVRSIEPIKAAKETGLESTFFLREFSGERDRDGAGRFSAGRVPSPTDYAIADAANKKKKVAAGAGAAAVLAGGALGGTAKGRAVSKSLGKAALRASSHLFP